MKRVVLGALSFAIVAALWTARQDSTRERDRPRVVAKPLRQEVGAAAMPPHGRALPPRFVDSQPRSESNPPTQRPSPPPGFDPDHAPSPQTYALLRREAYLRAGEELGLPIGQQRAVAWILDHYERAVTPKTPPGTPQRKAVTMERAAVKRDQRLVTVLGVERAHALQQHARELAREAVVLASGIGNRHANPPL